MKFSYSWLKELLPALALTPEQVADTLTLHSFETVVSHQLTIDPSVTVAKIIQLAPHPNADRLRLATITTGREEITVVCGAPNLSVGDVVSFSPVGAVLKDDASRDFILQAAKIRGVLSPGMLNSPRELGLGDWSAGLYLLPSDTLVGSKLTEHLPSDTILEADVTPNRAHDCLSHVGLARELAALLNLDVAEPQLPLFPASLATEFVVQSPAHTSRYLGAHLINLKLAPSPLWLQARLWAVGAKPINNVVDITNFVMFEFGNPSHAFDAQKLPGHTFSARLATTGEKLLLLDGTTPSLMPTQLLVTSNNQPVAVAGVMGGAATQVTEGTQEIFLEVANFNPFIIQESSRALKTFTESSARFNKGLSSELVTLATSRLLSLLQELAGAELVGFTDYYPEPPQPQPINFNPARVSRVAGLRISEEESLTSLRRLRCQVSGQEVTPPFDRLDLASEPDLIEEVIRLVGLSNIPSHAPVSQTLPLPPLLQKREALRDALVAAGFLEVCNYSFDLANLAEPLGLLNDQSLKLANPISPNEQYLRQSLLPRLLQNLVTNKAEIRTKQSRYPKAIFEIGTVFRSGGGGRVPGVIEVEHIAGLTLEHSAEELQQLFASTGLQVTVEPLDKRHQLQLPYGLLRELPLLTFAAPLDQLT
jgi:phenylalanyl-tRNA synthetase beta chain